MFRSPSRCLKLPVGVVLDRLNSPVKLLAQGLAEELLKWDIELIGEDDCQARIDIVLVKR